MSAARLVAVFAGVGLAVTLWIRTAPGPAAVPVMVEHASVDLDAIQRQLRSLEREQDLLLEDLSVLSDDLDEVDRAAPTLSKPTTPTPDMGRAQTAAQQTHIQAWFEDQSGDPDWSPSAESALLGALSELEGADLSAECVADMCRLELVFATGLDRDSTIPNVPFLLPWSGEGFVAPADEEGLAVVVYLAREGTTLPRLSS